MKAAASLVVGASASEAGRRAAALARDDLEARPELAVLFASGHYSAEAHVLLDAVSEELGRDEPDQVPLVGCVAGSVIGAGQEVEGVPAVSLWLACGFDPPGVETFSVEYLGTASGGLFAGHRFEPGGGPYLLFSDPFTFPLEELLEHLNANVSGALVAGGVAGGGVAGSRSSELFLDGRVLHEGAVGARLAGVAVDLIVSQGCRPIGSPYTVTKAEGHMLREIAGRPALERLEQLAAGLAERERALLEGGGLHLGVAMDEYRDHQGRGDFLVRTIMAADPHTGSLLLAGEIGVGQTVQFHVREATPAGQDLRDALEREADRLAGRGPAGVLLFSCNGRGSNLFPIPDHDAGMVATVLGPVPTVGFFAAGELGPVGGKNFLHTLSASLAVFR
jgi:small ligand-binding sensory domain FIST